MIDYTIKEICVEQEQNKKIIKIDVEKIHEHYTAATDPNFTKKTIIVQLKLLNFLDNESYDDFLNIKIENVAIDRNLFNFLLKLSSVNSIKSFEIGENVSYEYDFDDTDDTDDIDEFFNNMYPVLEKLKVNSGYTFFNLFFRDFCIINCTVHINKQDKNIDILEILSTIKTFNKLKELKITLPEFTPIIYPLLKYPEINYISINLDKEFSEKEKNEIEQSFNERRKTSPQLSLNLNFLQPENNNYNNSSLGLLQTELIV